MDDATATSDDCAKTDWQAGILGDMIMNELQRSFFQYLAGIQETCVEVCMAQHSCNDEKVRGMLYDVTYEVITDIMELIDGYSSFSSDEHDIATTVLLSSLFATVSWNTVTTWTGNLICLRYGYALCAENSLPG